MSQRIVTGPPRYDVDALYAVADLVLCCTRHDHAVPVDGEELVALLAEFRRMEPVVRAALEWHLAKMSPAWLKATVEEYLQARRDAGADGGRRGA